MKRRRKVNKKKVILFILIIIILVIGSIFIVSKLFDKEVVPSDNIIDKDNDKEYSINMLMVGDLLVHDRLYNAMKTSDGYDFKPKNKIEKDDLASISKVVLVEPEFIETIAKKNINKKLNILLKQIAIVLNDETDDEGADYVLGEIDRLASLVMGNYSKYLTKEYKNLIKNKLYMLKEEINLKQMMRAKTVDYSEEKGRSL